MCDRTIEDYSIAVYRGWKIGAAGEDSPGALLLVAVDDRKYRTEISRDLEDELPDGLAGQLQRQYLVPAFKQGNYGKGVSDTIDAYIRTIQAKQTGEPVANTTNQSGTTSGTTSRRSQNSSSGGFCNIVVCLII